MTNRPTPANGKRDSAVESAPRIDNTLSSAPLLAVFFFSFALSSFCHHTDGTGTRRGERERVPFGSFCPLDRTRSRRSQLAARPLGLRSFISGQETRTRAAILVIFFFFLFFFIVLPLTQSRSFSVMFAAPVFRHGAPLLLLLAKRYQEGEHGLGRCVFALFSALSNTRIRQYLARLQRSRGARSGAKVVAELRPPPQAINQQ